MFTRFRILAVAAGACALAGAGVAAAQSGAGSAPSQPSSHISALDRAPGPGDALSPALIQAAESSPGAIGQMKVDWAQARRTASNVWLVPAGDNLCLHVGTASSGGIACGPADAAASGQAFVNGDLPGKGPFVAGAVPDGVGSVDVELADGSQQRLPVSDNTYTASLGSPAVRLSFNGPSGPVSVEVPAAHL